MHSTAALPSTNTTKEDASPSSLQNSQDKGRGPALTIVKRGRGFAIMAGVSVLASGYRTHEAAADALDKDRAMLLYWAGSASVSIQNTTARVVTLGRVAA